MSGISPGGGIPTPNKTVMEIFLAQALQHADRIALVSADESLTYAELADRITCIAVSLRAHGVSKGQVVALSAERSIATIAAMLGILQAGAIVVPIDASYPTKLRQAIFEDCTPTLLLVDEAAQADSWQCKSINLTGLQLESLPVADIQLTDTTSNDPACVLYTSGSTGAPKGVIIPHRAIVRLVVDNTYAHLSADQTLLQLAPLSFDASLFEIFGALLNGGKLAIAPRGRLSIQAIAAAIAQFQVTTLWLTAGVFHLMAEHCVEGLRPLEQLLAGGDVLSPNHIHKALCALPACKLINGYGPTENTTFSCCYTVPSGHPPDAPVPIGKAIAGTSSYVFDDAMQPVPDGEVGELFVGGAGLALGYWNRPQQTAERFIQHAVSGERLYRTGDYVRMRPDGNLEFLGRRDRQIKINGKRVELDEVEACLRRSGFIADIAVATFETTSQQRRIAAFATPGLDKCFSMESLQAFMKAELPEHMRPASVTLVAELPLTPSGKVDRSGLLASLLSSSKIVRTPHGRTTPKNSMEATLLSLWQATLHVDHIGLDENFFDVGGTSLQLLELHATLAATIDSEIKLTQLFQFPSIAALATLLIDPAAAGVTRNESPSLQMQPAHLSVQTRTQHQRNALQRARGRAQIPRTN